MSRSRQLQLIAVALTGAAGLFVLSQMGSPVDENSRTKKKGGAESSTQLGVLSRPDHGGSSKALRDSRGSSERKARRDARRAKLWDLAKDPIISPNQRRSYQIELLALLAETDPRAGMEWIASLDPASGQEGAARVTFASVLAAHSFQDWERLYAELTDTDHRRQFLLGGVPGLGHTNAALAWETLQEILGKTPELRPVVETEIFERLSSRNGDGFWDVLQSGTDPVPSAMAEQFFKHASFEDQDRAVAALGQRGEDQLACVELYARSVAANDLPALGRSLLKCPLEGSAKDLGLATVVERSYYLNTGESARFIRAVRDKDLRAELEAQIRKYASLKGPAMKARVEEILSGSS